MLILFHSTTFWGRVVSFQSCFQSEKGYMVVRSSSLNRCSEHCLRNNLETWLRYFNICSLKPSHHSRIVHLRAWKHAVSVISCLRKNARSVCAVHGVRGQGSWQTLRSLLLRRMLLLLQAQCPQKNDLLLHRYTSVYSLRMLVID